MSDLSQEKSREQAFERALHALESCAATPFVPGEMVGWLTATEQAFEQVRALTGQQMRDVHSEMLSEIGQEDPELLRRVEILQQEDQDIREQGRQVEDRLQVLRPLVQRVEPDEKRVESVMSEFAQTLLDLVQRIRKQEVAMRTWHVEAFTRDRGAVD